MLGLQLLHSYNLHQIAQQAYQLDRQEKERKRLAAERITVPYLMTPHGFVLAQLFGYHLGSELRESLGQIGKKKGMVRVNQEQFTNLMSEVWVNMSQYKLFLPVLFSILKGYNNTVSIKDLSHYVEICKNEINPFMARIKELIPPHKIKELAVTIEMTCEREDLKNQGFVDKIIIVDLIKKYLENTKETIELDEKLVTNDEVNYKLLLGPSYLKSPQKVRLFLQGKLANKIKAFIKKCGQRRKSLKKKKQSKKAPTTRQKPKKETKEEKMVREYMQENRKEVKEDRRKLQLIIKSIIYQCIYSAATITNNQEENEQPEKPIKKSIYTAQQIVERQLQCFPGEPLKLFPTQHDSALFVSEGQGRIVNLLDGEIKSSFSLNPSRVLKSSPICDYAYFNHMLYVIREDGLLVSWNSEVYSYNKMVQSQFRYLPKTIEDFNSKNVLFIAQGIIVVNCCEINNSLELYSLDLQFIANIFLKKEEFGISHAILKQCREMKEILKGLKRDLTIKSQLQYQSLIRSSYQEKEYELGKYLFSKFDYISVLKAGDYADWATSYKPSNTLYLDKAMMQRLRIKKANQQDYNYLMTYQYIKEPNKAAVQHFLKTHSFAEVQRQKRKACLLTLFEDNSLKEVAQTYYLSRQQFIIWIEKCSLSPTQINAVFDNLTFNPQGKVCMYEFVHSEQYLKIVSHRQGRFYPQSHYQRNELPPIIINQIMPFPLLQFTIVTTRFPTYHILYVISFHNVIINQINLNQYLQQSTARYTPALSYCEESGYLAVSYHNVITLWNVNKLTQSTTTPVKIVVGLQRDPIIGLRFLYCSNTLTTLTHQQIKIWDLNQVFFNPSTAEIVFSIKPGFKAIEKFSEVSRWEPKKKILIRGKSLHFIASTTKSSNSLIGVVSKGQRANDAFIKLSYVCKFHILIGSNRNYDQVPTKILRQLQSQARRLRYSERILSQEKYNLEEQKMVSTMVESFRRRLGQVKQESSKQIFIALINKVSNLHSMLTQYSKIVSSQLLPLLQLEEAKSFKFNLILKIYLCESDQQLRSIFTPEFLGFYEEGKELNKDVIIQDIFEWQDRSYLNKFLCILSQVYKYSLPYKCGYAELIFNQKQELDSSLVQTLLVNSQISKNIIRYVISLANQIKIGTVRSVTIKIIDKFLPTHYRYPSLRYYKNIWEHSAQTPFDYFTNRFDQYTSVDPKEVILSPKGYSQIFEHIEKQKLLDKLESLSKIYPQIIKDNLQLVDICMSYSLITEQQATFYILSTTNLSLFSLLADSPPKKNIIDFDSVIGGIVYTLSQRRMKIPTPHFTYMWFYDNFKAVIANDDKLYDIFYNELRGSLTQHIAYSRELQFYIDLNKKNIRINYNPISWKHLIGTRIYPLTNHIEQLRQAFSKQKVVSCISFQRCISQLVPRQAQTITVRACAASKNHDSFINSFNEERLLKDYQQDYINADHFFFYLEESRKEKQAQSLSISHLSNNSSLQLKVPSYSLINLLSKYSAFLTRHQLTQIASQSISQFTYGGLVKWLNSMPFTRMRGKDKRELRVCAIWELKNYLKVDWQTVGWMLLGKYGKANILNKCMIVEGTIDVKQLNQVFLSEALFKLLVASNPQLKDYDQTYPLEVLQRVVERELVNPALEAIYLVFRNQINKHLPAITDVLSVLANKSEEIEMDKFARYFLTHPDTKESILKLIFTNLIGRTKKIKIKEALTKLAAFTKNPPQSALQTLARWIKSQSEQQKSLLQIVVPLIQPHRILKKKEISSQKLIITRQHITELTMREEPWVYSYQPFLTLPQFFDFLALNQGQNDNLSNLINNCIIKHGVHSIFKSIEQGSFPQFYAKCRSVSKNLAKLTLIQFSKLYEILSDEGKKLSLSKLFKASQTEIVADQRINWIIEYMQKSDKDQKSLQHMRICNLLSNMKEPAKQLQGLVATLKYEEYLIKRYVKSANKLVVILRQLQDPVATYQILNQIHLTHQQASVITKYLKIHGQEMLSKMRESQSVVITELTQTEEKVLLQEIAEYMNYFQEQMSLTKANPEYNPNMFISEKWISETSLFKRMREENTPQWSCLTSYVNLYQYCRYLLVNTIFKKYKYRQMITDLLNKTLTSLSLQHKVLYQIFSLAYMDNLNKYLPFFISPNAKHHALQPKLYKVFQKYLCQSFITFDGVTEVKYPLNLSGFTQLLGLNEAKTQAKTIDYGEIYKRLNIWGCGYVNLNDIYQYRLRRLSFPYIEINSHIAETYPSVKEWRKINPPSQVFQNREKICIQLIRLESPSPLKSKLIAQANLWRIMGYYLTKQHRLYIEHEFRIKNNPEYYNIVEVIDWINTSEEEEQAQTAEILANVVVKIEQEGGIYNILRKYHKHIILSQQVDSHQQQAAYLIHLLEESSTLHLPALKQFVKELLQSHKIQQYTDTQHTVQNQRWLQQSLRAIVDVYNKEVREWSNYNNSLVKFLNELPQGQFCLIKQLYQANHQYSCHKLFDILASGAQYFTFTSFWVYNTSSHQAYPYSKEEVHEVYKIIDVNSDSNISYQEFCRFWSAVEQIFVRPSPPSTNKLVSLKAGILQTFLDSIQNILEKEVQSEKGSISIDQLEVLTNIKNKQKLQRLIRVVSPQDKMGKQIDIHKLKVLLKQHKIRKNNQLQAHIQHANYFAIALGQEIQLYVNSKENLQNTLSKWLAFTYPNFGYYLAQVCHELAWSKDKITEWISQFQQPPAPTKAVQPIITPKQATGIPAQNEHLLNRVIDMPKQFQLFYKKFIRRNTEPKSYGKSISYKLYLDKIVEEYAVIIKQIDHLTYFLSQTDSDQNKLIYKLQPTQHPYQSPPQLNTLPAFQRAVKIGQVSFSNPRLFNIKDNLHLQQAYSEYFLRRQYQVVNKQLRGRSNNRLSLIANKALYSDPKISISFYDQNYSNISKLVLYSDYSHFKPLPSVQIAKNSKFTGLQSMIRLIDLAAYIQKEYQMISLFTNLNNLCIDFQGQRQFKLSEFIGGIRLDAQGSYLEGVNPKDINSDHMCIYPPQVYENIFTETFDSYCLAHILYYLYTGELVQNKELVPSAQESYWFNYSELHYKAKQQISFLALQDKNLDIESQLVFFTLIYQCTSFEWHLRPKVHQIAETLRNIALLNCALENIGQSLIVKAPISQICLQAAQAKNINAFSDCVKASKDYQWSIAQIQKIRVVLPEDPKYYALYNQLLQQILVSFDEGGEVQVIGEFMKSAVEYICQSSRKQTAFLALQIYKNIITSGPVKRYFEYCDDQWKINEFNIHEKLKQLNTHSRIQKLPKSSQYYLDICTLIDTKITLYMTTEAAIDSKTKKHDSTKKIAISFIESSLLSHNVNKICALQKSGVLLNLYKYLDDPEFESTVLRIYCLATSCLNEDEVEVVHRAMEEGYKVMMVMHNILNLERGVRTGETVVDMLTYMNNYYHFYGEECKREVLQRLCRTQICSLPTLTFLFNLKIQNMDLLYKLLLNLTYSQSYYRMLKGVTIQAYEVCLKELRKSPKHQQLKVKIQKLIQVHQAKITLNELSSSALQLQNRQLFVSKQSPQFLSQYQSLIERHVLFYRKRLGALTKGSHFRYQNNFYEHYSNFLSEMRTMGRKELDSSYFNSQSCSFVKAVLDLHLSVLQLWCMQEDTIRYLMQFAQQLYQTEFLYVQNVLLNSIQKTVFDLLTALLKKSPAVMVKLGFMHFLMRVMKKQHQLIGLYVRKGVENIQLKKIYSQEAEFRLNAIDLLLQGNQEDIHRIFVILAFPKYLIEVMLASTLLLDLRYYKANFDIVPFRFCNPLRSEAITILSFILPIKDSVLRAQVVSRLIPVIAFEKSKLEGPVDTPQSKMRFVQALWLFGNIIECEEERLKYEFVNNGGYQAINSLITRYQLLSVFFPKMSQTMKTGSILKSSVVFSRLLTK